MTADRRSGPGGPADRPDIEERAEVATGVLWALRRLGVVGEGEGFSVGTSDGVTVHLSYEQAKRLRVRVSDGTPAAGEPGGPGVEPTRAHPEGEPESGDGHRHESATERSTSPSGWTSPNDPDPTGVLELLREAEAEADFAHEAASIAIASRDRARAEAARYREALERVMDEIGRCVYSQPCLPDDPAQRVPEDEACAWCIARAALAHQDGASRVPDGTDGEGGE